VIILEEEMVVEAEGEEALTPDQVEEAVAMEIMVLAMGEMRVIQPTIITATGLNTATQFLVSWITLCSQFVLSAESIRCESALPRPTGTYSSLALVSLSAKIQ
jgi:hypothetical protein